MIELYDGGAYLVNGDKLVKDSDSAASEIKNLTGKDITKEEASKGTMAYNILNINS